jgi:hypothetical protein
MSSNPPDLRGATLVEQQQQQQQQQQDDEEYPEDQEDTMMVDEELSEEEDDDFIEDISGHRTSSNGGVRTEDDGSSSLPTTRSSLRAVTDAHNDSNGGSSSNNVNSPGQGEQQRVDDDDDGGSGGGAGGAMPVLLEGDYFPQQVPAGVLAELSAVVDDADDFHDDVVVSSPPAQPHLTHDKEAVTIDRGDGGAANAVTSPDTLAPIDLNFVSPDTSFHASPPAAAAAAARMEMSSVPAVLPPSMAVSYVPSTAVRRSSISTSPSHNKTAAPASRKRVRWVDEVQMLSGRTSRALASRSLVHHASSFTIPGQLQPPPLQHDVMRTSSARRSAAAEHQLQHAPVQVFREVVNEDRSSYFACRPQRPSLVFSQWKHTALKQLPSQQQQQSEAQEHGESDAIVPPTPIVVPYIFGDYVKGTEPRGKSERSFPTSNQLYRYLHRDAQPLLGTITLHANERFATRMITIRPCAAASSSVTTEGSSSRPQLLLDDGGLVQPPMWAGLSLQADQYKNVCLLHGASSSEKRRGDEAEAAPIVAEGPLMDAPLWMHW